MSVIGIDFGNENCFIAVARAGGIETIANEYSQRTTPSYVAFGERQRDIGVSAKNKQNTNIKQTVYGFKRFVGKTKDDPSFEYERQLLPFHLVSMPDGEVGVVVRYGNDEKMFGGRQITAMLFTKLKEIAEAALKIKVFDCVISVPSFFSDVERNALLDAAKIAGLNCLRLMNETTAVALNYGFYKNDLPEDKPRLVAFVDLGHAALQVSVVGFSKDSLKMLSCETDLIGGRDFDRVLVDYFAEDITKRFKLQVRENKRAIIRLYTECEKIKKQMSSVNVELPMNIECFMEDTDVNGKMKRDLFEELAASILKRVDDTIKRAIENCPRIDDKVITAADIDSVEIVGGSSRIPAVKAIIRNIFGREPSTTLNADEAVARGCALQCAMLSPTFKVKDFSITDLQPYAVAFRAVPMSGAQPTQHDVFPRNHAIPFAKYLTFYYLEPFHVEAVYTGPNAPFTDKPIVRYRIDVKPTKPTPSEGDKVKVKVRINPHGILAVSSATLHEKLEENENAQEVQDSSQDGGDQQQNNTDPVAVNGATPEEMEAEQAKEPAKKKGPKTKQTDFTPIPEMGLSPDLLQMMCSQEAGMINADRTEQQRLDAKNAVEEYVYDLRDKLGESYVNFASEDEKTVLSQQLAATEDWLYGDGEDVEKKLYTERLDQLHNLGQPIEERYRESQERPRALEELGAALMRVRKAIAEYKAGDVKYEHWSEDDVAKLNEQVNTKQQWFDEIMGKVNTTAPHLPPPIFVSQIREERKSFERAVNPVMGKPKPRPPTPPKEETMENAQPQDNGGAAPTAEQNSDQSAQQENGAEAQVPMEVD